eukprot:jgi/Psemu1/261756/estExt_Genewise1Plus.C_6230023
MVAEVQFSRGFDLLYKIHDNEAALLEFNKSLKIRETILGKDHRDTGKTYCFVGHTLREMRDYDNSLGQYRSALRILVALLGKNHNELMESNGGDFDLAIEAYKKALIVEEIDVIGKYHPDTAEIYSKIGSCLARTGDLKKACVEYGNALSIYAVTLGSDHRDTKEALKHIQNLPSLMMR